MANLTHSAAGRGPGRLRRLRAARRLPPGSRIRFETDIFDGDDDDLTEVLGPGDDRPGSQ